MKKISPLQAANKRARSTNTETWCLGDEFIGDYWQLSIEQLLAAPHKFPQFRYSTNQCICDGWSSMHKPPHTPGIDIWDHPNLFVQWFKIMLFQYPHQLLLWKNHL